MDHTNHIELLSKLWHRLVKLTQYQEMEWEFERIKDLSPLEIGIISLVSRRPDIIFREICEEFCLPKSTLTNVIDRLERRRYLKRTISQRDRRTFGLELSEEGALAQKEHLEYEKKIYSKIINALESEEDKLMLLSLVGKIVENLEK